MARTATKEKTTPVEMSDGATTGQELTVTNGAPPAGPKTVAQQNKEKLQKVLGELAKRADDYRPLLQAHNIPWDVFTAVIQQALIKVPFTLKCTTASILQACMRAAADGLFPDGDECALVPFKNSQANTYEATYVPGYKGMLKCAYAMEDGTGAKVYQDVDVDVIYEGEEGFFQVRKGTDPSLTFAPPLNRDINKPVIGAYAVVRTNNGGVFIEVVGQMELGKIANVSKAKNGPREKWSAEMHKKGPLRRLLKRTPKDQRLARLMSHDEEAYLPDAVSLVDGDETTIPDSKLFDDTAHQVEDHSGDANDMMPATHEEALAAAVAMARADLMAAETEEALNDVIRKIEASAVFSEDEFRELMGNASQLRKAKFGGSEGGVGVDDDADAEGLEGISAAQDALDADLASEGIGDGDVVHLHMQSDGETTALTSHEIERAERPTETASAQVAAPSQGSSASATPASSASPAASSSSPDSSPPRVGGWKEAPAEQRVTPAKAMLDGGVHFKAQTSVNAHGQLPYFNDDDEIVGWAKPDLDIPTRAVGEEPQSNVQNLQSATAADAPIVGETVAFVSVTTEAGTVAVHEPQIRTNPEDRQEPEHDDDVYGDDAPALVLRFKGHPKKPPREYDSPVNWRDEILFRIGTVLKVEGAIFSWWKDNCGFVEDAAQIDDLQTKIAVGKVVARCVALDLPGAAELVDKYGPFGK